MSATTRERLALATAGLLALLVVADTASSGSVRSLRMLARNSRGALLVVLFLVVLVAAIGARRTWRIRPWVALALGGLLLFFLDSAAWSVLPGTTVKKLAALAGIVALAALVAGVATSWPRWGLVVLDALLAGVGVVVAAGFILWLFDSSSAVQPASVQSAARFTGLGHNPDAAAMVLAIGMPIALARALSPGARLARASCWALLLAAAAEITAADSRGALVAGFLSLLVVVWLAPMSLRRRIGGSAAVVAALVVCAAITTIPSALPAPATKPAQAIPKSDVADAEKVLPLEQEIGSPWWTHRSGLLRRSLLGSGARGSALRGAIDQGLGRPALGTGFGAEEFVNRYYGYNSGNPEDGYVGLFMQTGVVGLALFLVAVGVCLLPLLRRRVRARLSNTYAGAAGAAVAGLLLGLSQSYFHSAGNIAAVPFWIVLLLASSAPLALVDA